MPMDPELERRTNAAMERLKVQHVSRVESLNWAIGVAQDSINEMDTRLRNGHYSLEAKKKAESEVLEKFQGILHTLKTMRDEESQTRNGQ